MKMWQENTKYNFVFRSDGGSPPPVLEARVEVHGKQSHRLTPVSFLTLVKHECTNIYSVSKAEYEISTQTGDVEGRGGHLEQSFKLDPRVSERTDRHTFAVCEAVQVGQIRNAEILSWKSAEGWG